MQRGQTAHLKSFRFVVVNTARFARSMPVQSNCTEMKMRRLFLSSKFAQAFAALEVARAHSLNEHRRGQDQG
jgi:hypothetical protein